MSEQTPLGRFYYWIWHDLAKAKEPFTYSVRKWQKSNPLFFLLLFLIIGLCVGCKLKSWKAIGIVVGIIIAGVLLGHLFW